MYFYIYVYLIDAYLVRAPQEGGGEEGAGEEVPPPGVCVWCVGVCVCDDIFMCVYTHTCGVYACMSLCSHMSWIHAAVRD